MRYVLYYLIVLVTSGPACANVVVSVVEPPAKPTGTFLVSLVGASETDPTPNPCHRKPGCVLYFYTIDESWLPAGLAGYSTADAGWAQRGEDDADFLTLGDWVTYTHRWGNTHRIGNDYLPDDLLSDGPCVVVAAGIDSKRMIPGTIVSNCARGIVQAPTCELLPSMINLSTELYNRERNHHEVLPDTPIQLTCTHDSDVQIETNTGERIPLGGMSEFYAELDWGAGYGKPGSYKVTANEPSTVRLRASIQGYEKIEPGKYSGTAVVNVSYL